MGVKQTGWYIAVFAASNFAGALLLSPLFDRIGRVKMITFTYVLSGVLLGIAGFVLGDLTATTLTLFGAIIFFFASAGASAAYLTASEVFPMETRALCIAFFYAVGTAAGGISGPLLFGKLIEDASASGDITGIAIGYYIGAALMIAGGIVEAFLGVRAEGKSLESIAQPLTAEDARGDRQPARPRLTPSPPRDRGDQHADATPQAHDRGSPGPPGPPRDGPDRPCHRGQRPPDEGVAPRSRGRGVLGGGPLRPCARARGRRRTPHP